MTDTAEKPAHPLVVFNQQLRSREGEFKAALPPHMPVERFTRVVMTAVQTNPELLDVERRSFFNACMRSAQDGLLPDGKEAAIVVRKDRQRGKIANYQPMIAGIRKKARNSGEITTWDAHVVREGDHFQFQLGDNPQINHTYDLSRDRGRIVGAYSVCALKDGSRSYEVMSIDEIHDIRGRSDAWKAFKANFIKSTPWSTDEGEMCRKTVAKRHSKVLPLSTDLDTMIRADDEEYEPASPREPAAPEPRRPRLVETMDRLSQMATPEPEPETTEAGELGEITATAGEETQIVDEINRSTSDRTDRNDSGDFAEAADDAVEEAEEPDARTALFEALREVALDGGTRKLNLRLGGLSPDQQALLTQEDIVELRATAQHPRRP